MDVYLIMLQGFGDTCWKLVRKDGWDLLDRSGAMTPEIQLEVERSYDPLDHQEVLEALNDPNAGEDDIAGYLPGAVINGSVAEFYDTLTFMEFVKNNNLNVVQEFHGKLF